MEQSLAKADQNQHQHHDDDIFDQHPSQYNLSLKFGSRIFTPRPFTTLLTLALLVMLLLLGRWQLHRADEKRALYQSFAAGADATRDIDGQTPPLPRYQHVEARGHYDESRQILIDNMFDAQSVGYYVITPFALDGGGWVLVNRGWVPLGKSRAARPSVPVNADSRQIRGRADHLPAAGIQMGQRPVLGPPYPVVASFPNHDELAQLLQEPQWTAATDVILLDPAEEDGYARHWAPPGFPPIRHIGYAVQWFALAAALFVIYLVMNFKRAATGAIPKVAP
jgi:surfeit locus 1 family protein